MKVAKQDMKRVLDALQQLNDLRLNRIRELIRERNDARAEVEELKKEVTEARNYQDERMVRWRQRWVSLRDENKRLREQLELAQESHRQDAGALSAQIAGLEQDLQAARRAMRNITFGKKVAADPTLAGCCGHLMYDEQSSNDDPHWCDKSPDHEQIEGPSPHRCGDCKKEWVEVD